MEEKTYTRLEFDKVLQQLAAHAHSAPGKELALALRPSKDPDTVLAWQAETTQARELMRFEPSAEFGGWHDIRGQILRLRRNAVLQAEELFFIGETLAASRRIKRYLLERRMKYPSLAAIAEGLAALPELEKAILSAILPGGEIDDRATPELAQIRRRKVSAQAKVRERLERIIRSPENQKYLQEGIVTIRADRYVVPVKLEYRNMIPGIVHDQSASGATLFVEPMSVVEANNEVRQMLAAEKQEIQRILTKLSNLAASVVDDLSHGLDALAYLDFVLAKAAYSRKLDAWQPQVLKEPRIYLKQARHPLITGKVVPITVWLGKEFNTLIITGPNTGGKTVTLKTVGLMVLMTQAGLHIPAETGSEVGIFHQVFADIGDEQSIEQSLSTFSSHMSNIVNIIKQADKRSLIMLDELGSGTDPAEGAAIAQAILQYLHNLGARTIATTHYSELKNFAYANPGIENASVEFNSETLRPTYRLLIGKPGRSNAFEIAARLGLPEELVKSARAFQTKEQIQVSELMRKLEITQQQAEKERRLAEQMRRESEQLKERYERLERQITERKEEILSKAREEAQQIVRRAEQESEEAIKELRQKLSEQSAREREEAIKAAREKLSSLYNKNISRQIKKAQTFEVPKKLRPGDEVYLPRYNQKGYVLEIGDQNQVTVQAGILKLTVSKDELQLVKETKHETGQTEIGNVIRDKAMKLSGSLDMRGMKVDEALMEMEKYLDDAYLVGLKQVSLIHGKGTGALRAAVHRELKKYPRVKSFRLGEIAEGGDGITVVELK